MLIGRNCMKAPAKLHVCKSRTVLVMSPTGGSGNCPRLVLAGKRGAVLRDDYRGSLPARRRLFSGLCSL